MKCSVAIIASLCCRTSLSNLSSIMFAGWYIFVPSIGNLNRYVAQSAARHASQLMRLNVSVHTKVLPSPPAGAGSGDMPHKPVAIPNVVASNYAFFDILIHVCVPFIISGTAPVFIETLVYCQGSQSVKFILICSPHAPLMLTRPL